MPTDTSYCDLPTCPRCGFEDRDWWDGWPMNAEARDVECPSCEAPYRVEMHVSRTFTTTLSEDSANAE